MIPITLIPITPEHLSLTRTHRSVNHGLRKKAASAILPETAGTYGDVPARIVDGPKQQIIDDYQNSCS